MRDNPIAAAVFVALVVTSSCAVLAKPTPYDVPYGIAIWPEKGRGNHRALVRVRDEAPVVRVHIPWRRRDRHPERKDVRVFDQATGERVRNVVRVRLTRTGGDLLFQPPTVPGGYEVYYLPYAPPGGGPFGDGGNYFPPQETADPAWVKRNKLTRADLATGDWQRFPEAEVVAIQARGEFHRMDPMEIIATPAETAALLRRFPDRPYLVFPEDRKRPIRMFEDLPLMWVQRGPATVFIGRARPGEFYPFQLGIWAARKAISNLHLTFRALRSANGRTLPVSRLRCFNLSGTDWLGRPMKKTFTVAQGVVRPLWIGIDVPRDATGEYRGTVQVEPRGLPATTIEVRLQVSGPELPDHGDSELWRYSRLRWLDSTLGLDDDVVAPFTSVELHGDTAEILLRKIHFAPSGLPDSIRASGREILARPVEVAVHTRRPLHWRFRPTAGRRAGPATIQRETHGRAEGLRLTVRSKLEADGCLQYRWRLTAERRVRLTETELRVPLRRDVAKYLMGMGRRGGYAPPEWRWKWNVEQADNMVWLGDFDAGVQLKLCGPTDAWQTRDLKDTGVPPSWSNGGKGGCDIRSAGGVTWVRAYTGPRTLDAGETVELRFRFLITPFKPIDKRHWNWRYGDVRGRANILHLHHGTAQNPNINYPFLHERELRKLVQEVKSLRSEERDLGKLTYPAKGNLDPGRGALHLWVQVNFDPQAGKPRDARFNQPLFSLDFPNEDQLGFYWNIDDRGMRTYVRIGPPTENRYPVLFGTHSPDWRKGQRHLLTLSWGSQLEVFVDGQRLHGMSYRGTLTTPLTGATLNFRGKGFVLDAVKIVATPFTSGTTVTPTGDRHTLLLDTFARWDGGAETHPERIVTGSGRLSGVCRRLPGRFGNALAFSSRRVETPPKGVNIYYTVRELSNHVVEMWALRSLGDEIFKTGGVDIYAQRNAAAKPFKGYPWLREHLVTGYVTAWRQPLGQGDMDAALAVQGLSRWHNYYIEGLRYLMQRTGVDGLYLDGIGYDREIMKRVAKVMRRTNPNSRINFHSGDNWRPPWDRRRRISAANQYLEHFPYLSNLWFGELFDYSMPPDYWLVEISGIPFGLTGEMLNYQTGGNPYRGMVYGMTSRQHPSHEAMWGFWDDFGIQEAEMLGYWDPRCPVRTNRPEVRATVYRKPNRSLIALARWPKRTTRPQAFLRPTTTPPRIDGRLSPGEWDGAARLTNFLVFAGEEPARNRTQVHVACDRRNLYVGFHCQQPEGEPKVQTTRRDGPVWEDDAVEFFFQPDVTKSGYAQFVGNSAGVIADGRGRDLRWNGDWRYRTSVGKGWWEGELSVPLQTLGIALPDPLPADFRLTLGFNACRDQQTPTRQLSCWSPVNTSFHDETTFGRLIVSAAGPVTRRQPDQTREKAVERVRLQIDWEALGLDPDSAELTAPPLAFFQRRARFSPTDAIPVARGKGWLLVVENRSQVGP